MSDQLHKALTELMLANVNIKICTHVKFFCFLIRI